MICFWESWCVTCSIQWVYHFVFFDDRMVLMLFILWSILLDPYLLHKWVFWHLRRVITKGKKYHMPMLRNTHIPVLRNNHIYIKKYLIFDPKVLRNIWCLTQSHCTLHLVVHLRNWCHHWIFLDPVVVPDVPSVARLPNVCLTAPC